MKKKNEQKKEIIREVLEGVVAYPDYEIIRKVQEDGSALYYHPADEDNPEPVNEQDLCDVVREPIRRVKALVELLDDDDQNRFGFIAEAITEEAERLYDDVFYFLDEAIGKIKIDVMGRRSAIYRTGRVLGARITPKKVAA
jgi:hypothetical protein